MSNVSASLRVLFFLIPLMLESASAQSIVQVIPLPNSTYWNQAWGMTADSSHLYIASNTSDVTLGRRIYTLDFDGAVVDSVDAPAGVNSSQGLARDSAGNFYYLRRYTSSGTILKLSPEGAAIDSFRVGSSRYPGGVAWDGAFIWFSLYYPNNECGLYKVNWTTKTIVDTILVPSQQPYGVDWDGTSLLYVENGFDGGTRGVVYVDPVTGDTTGFIPEPVDGGSNGTSPRDVAWDGRYLWLLAEPVGASSGRALYKYDLGGSGTPDITLSTSLLDFGNVHLGSPSTLTISILNNGTAPLTVDSTRMQISTHFSAPLVTPVTIGAGSSQQVDVTFTPAAFGPDTASLQVFSDDPDEPMIRLALRGSGIFPTGTLSAPAGYNFGPRRIGSSSSWNMTLLNQGGGSITISGLSLSNPEFSIDTTALPMVLDALQSTVLKVWYRPTGASASDTLRITSDAANGPVTPVWLTGSGDATPVPIGQPLWQYAVPLHPISNTFKTVKGVRAINDITGDGKPEIVVCTENYWNMVVNGNGSVSTDSIWAFSTYISNSSAGSIGSAGDYSYQKALQIASDLNGDGSNDIVIGTGGGNEHVYALNGRTGEILWTFGTDDPDSFGLGDITAVDVQRDFTGDGIPDVLAAAAATESGGIGGRRSAYLFNGATGAQVWRSPLPGFTHGIVSLGDIDADGIPDAAGAVGQPSYKMTAFSGATGALLWDFEVSSGSGGGKEVMEFPVAGQSPDIILSAFWGPVYRVDGESGTQMWSISTGGSGVMQLKRIHDVTGDGIDDVVYAMLLGGAQCVNGATGTSVWYLPVSSVMGLDVVPDLDQDGYDEVALAVQNQGAMIVRGQDGTQLALFSTGSNQCREIAAVPDMDGNNSFEIIFGGKEGNVGLLSGGVNAGPNAVLPPVELPSGWSLHQNYPNPFNPSTTIAFDVPRQSDVTITIYDILGREVTSFALEHVPPGSHDIVWNGTTSGGVPVASGAYLYRMQSSGVTLTRSMLLLK